MPALPDGKPAGVPCPHLTADVRCALWGRPERPAVCITLRPQPEMCGTEVSTAMATLVRWESLTAPRLPAITPRSERDVTDTTPNAAR
jgi:hypothetical protein